MARVGGMTFMPITATCNVGGHLGGYRAAGLVHDGGILPGGAVEPFRRRGFVDFCGFVNGGIFCGICGFLAA